MTEIYAMIFTAYAIICIAYTIATVSYNGNPYLSFDNNSLDSCGLANSQSLYVWTSSSCLSV